MAFFFYFYRVGLLLICFCLLTRQFMHMPLSPWLHLLVLNIRANVIIL